MRFVTFTLALLTASSLAAVPGILWWGDRRLLVTGLAVFAIGVLTALVAEHAAALLRAHNPADRFKLVALSSGAVAPVMLVSFVLVATRILIEQATASPMWLHWLFAYGAVAGSWTLFAAITRLEPMTLSRVHAYIGHLLTIAALSMVAMRCVPGAIVGVTILLATPSVIVGTLAAMTLASVVPGLRK